MNKIALLFCLFLLSGCLSKFQHPVTRAGEQLLDPGLYGSWYWKSESDNGFIHIGKVNENEYKLLMVEMDSDRSIQVTEYRGHSSSKNGMNYLNFYALEDANKLEDGDKLPGYMLAKYEVSNQEFVLYLADPTFIKDSIERKEIAGKIIQYDWYSEEYVTDSPDKLADFLYKNDQAIFDDSASLNKFE